MRLFTLKSRLLDNVVDDLDRFWSLKLMESAAFERYNVHFERAQRVDVATERLCTGGECDTIGGYLSGDRKKRSDNPW